jgi:hypothetical protein
MAIFRTIAGERAVLAWETFLLADVYDEDGRSLYVEVVDGDPVVYNLVADLDDEVETDFIEENLDEDGLRAAIARLKGA